MMMMMVIMKLLLLSVSAAVVCCLLTWGKCGGVWEPRLISRCWSTIHKNMIKHQPFTNVMCIPHAAV